MPGFLYQFGALANCPHGGQVVAASKNTMVFASGTPVVLATDQCVVAGCAFATPAGPQPCVKVQWTGPFTTSSLYMGQPAVTALTQGLCIAANGVANGPVVIAGTQQTAVAL
jgi:hypothetical protein